MRLKHYYILFFSVVALFVYFFLIWYIDFTHVKKLTQEFETTKIHISKMEMLINNLSNTDLNNQSENEKSAFLIPGTRDYTTIKFDLGILTVSILNILPYENGVKVTLQFGNPLSVSIDGLKATIEFGSLDEKGHPVINELILKEVTFNQLLNPGAMTDISFILNDIPYEQFDFLRISNLSHNSIRLYKQ
ncbi:DUF3251 domain-containing protein [candidate division KSB1 bacterium]|nr:DUF3251 domain-containing protein [candidate division KSB1 bacterium]